MAKRSSPGCTRLTRQAGNGYWHMNGSTKKVYASNNVLAGTTTALTYMAATEGDKKKKKKTNWVMHEYRLDPSYFDKSQPQNMELVLYSLQESGRGEEFQSRIVNHHEPLLAVPTVDETDADASFIRLLEKELMSDIPDNFLIPEDVPNFGCIFDEFMG
ncbi:hypothetical protein J5N97_000814 [Dioscorea zingiberensis]|uniref:NAC domain-containing protein n=1 Tax=Dioscorea zingiberensis TaxID=325984 RepID=A0A9D5BVC0_9LILI|nr:hypothetical protein J5N97_000814 [Dioscorea zingiberensis]